MSLITPAYKLAWRARPFSMLLATWFGVGHIPGGPGTYAAILVTPALVWLSMHVGLEWRVLGLIALSVISCVWCDRAEQAMGEEDSRRIVLDEVVGVAWAVVWWDQLGWMAAVLGLGLFRIFDMWKPWPISWVDARLSGGTGIMVDDVIAGWIAAMILVGLGLVLPLF